MTASLPAATTFAQKKIEHAAGTPQPIVAPEHISDSMNVGESYSDTYTVNGNRGLAKSTLTRTKDGYLLEIALPFVRLDSFIDVAEAYYKFAPEEVCEQESDKERDERIDAFTARNRRLVESVMKHYLGASSVNYDDNDEDAFSIAFSFSFINRPVSSYIDYIASEKWGALYNEWDSENSISSILETALALSVKIDFSNPLGLADYVSISDDSLYLRVVAMHERISGEDRSYPGSRVVTQRAIVDNVNTPEDVIDYIALAAHDTSVVMLAVESRRMSYSGLKSLRFRDYDPSVSAYIDDISNDEIMKMFAS